MLKKILKKYFHIFQNPPQDAQVSTENLLALRRLKRNVGDDLQAVPQKQTASQFFLLGILAMFALIPFKAVLAAPFLTLSSFSGHPTSVSVSGGGFTAGETVNVYLNSTSGTPAATAKAGKNSLFGPVQVTLPPNTPQGAVQIFGVGQQSSISVSNNFFVAPFAPVINIASNANTPGSRITISGKGFAPGESVGLTFGTVPIGTAKADTKGDFAKVTAAVPDLGSDTYLIHAKGAASGAETVGYFFVGNFYPTAGPDNYFLIPGQKVTFSGSGFAPNENIALTIGQDPSPVVTFIANKSGGFINAGAYQIPLNAGSGTETLHLKSQKTGADISMGITIGQFNSLVSPDNYFVSPGQKVRFYGKGFAPNEPIQITQGLDQNVLGTIKADKNGGFAGAGNLQIPYSSASSTVGFLFTGQSSNSKAETKVTVGSFHPLINPSEYYLKPGKNYTIWGTGFAPNEKVDVSSSSTTFTITTDKFGVFKTSGPFVVPYNSGGTQLGVTAAGRLSGAKSSLTLNVGNLYPLIVPTNYYITPGDNVTLSGYGFAPGENVLLKSGQNDLGVISTDKFGNFTNHLVTTPFAGGQNLNFTFVGAKSSAATDLTVSLAKLHPLVTLDSYSATPGSTIKAKGSGFTKGEPVTVKIGSEIFATAADQTGTTPWVAVTLPLDLLSKNVTVAFSGNATNAVGTAQVSYAAFNPQVYPSSYFVTPGKTVNFKGMGFAPHESVGIIMNGNTVGTTTVSVAGNFLSQDFPVPFGASTLHFGFNGNLSQASSTVDLSLAPFNPQVYPSSYYTPAGSSVTFHGNGFAPGETVSIGFNQSLAGSVTADAKGNFTTSKITIPFNTTAAHFTFNGSLTQMAKAVDIDVAALNPVLILSSYYDTGGKPLTVSGYGFSSGEKVNVMFDNSSLGSVTTATSGSFSLKTTVPFASSGKKTVQATGQSSGAAASATFSLPEVFVNLQLKSYAGAPGSAVTFIGTGFSPNEQVNITTDRNGSDVVETFTADAKGNFNNSSYMVPSNFKGGPLTFTVAGARSMISKSVIYYVTGP